MKRSQALSLTILLAVAIFGPASVLAQSSYATDTTASQSVAGCTGDSVSVSENFHFQYNVAADPNGGFRYDITITGNLSGVAQQSQAMYTGKAGYGYGFTTTDSPAVTAIQLSAPMTSDSAAGLTLILPVSLTMDTSGNITANVGTASASCAQ